MLWILLNSTTHALLFLAKHRMHKRNTDQNTVKKIMEWYRWSVHLLQFTVISLMIVSLIRLKCGFISREAFLKMIITIALSVQARTHTHTHTKSMNIFGVQKTFWNYFIFVSLSLYIVLQMMGEKIRTSIINEWASVIHTDTKCSIKMFNVAIYPFFCS